MPGLTISALSGARNIDVDALLAVESERSFVILDAIGYGPVQLDEMEEFVRKNERAKKGSCLYAEVERMKKALPFMRQIKWC